MNPKKSSLVLSLLFGAAFFLPADSMLGQSCAPNCVVAQGVDLFKTAAIAGATVADFSNQPLPMDFFCPGSAIFSGQIPLQGVPIVTSSPTTGGADTIIARLTDADLTNGTATVPIEVVALQLEQIAPLQISCSGGSTSWNVSVCLCEDQPTSEIDLTVTDPNGGEFSGTSIRLIPASIRQSVTGRASSFVRPRRIAMRFRLMWLLSNRWSMRAQDRAR